MVRRHNTYKVRGRQSTANRLQIHLTNSKEQKNKNVWVLHDKSNLLAFLISYSYLLTTQKDILCTVHYVYRTGILAT